MDGGDADLSARARMRAAAAEQREERARLRSEILELVVSGYTYEAIAEKLGLSVKSVRRATAKAIEKRRLDCGAHYVHLQVLRLTKAMRVVDLNLEKGDLKAVEPLLKVIAQLDKYHALSAPAPAPPPLALGRPALALAAPEAAEIGTKKGAQAVEIA
jgi:DNA-binding CsgD family transcriptional regulator